MMKKFISITFIIMALLFLLPQTIFAQSSDITTYWQGHGLVDVQDIMTNIAICDDSASAIDGDTAWSSTVFIGNYVGTGGGHGIVQYYMYSPDNDSTAYRGNIYQLAVKTGRDLLWTTYGTLSDTLYNENTLNYFEIDFDTLAAFLYMRVGMVASTNADSTFWSTDQVCSMWFSAPLNAYYHNFIYKPDEDNDNDVPKKIRKTTTTGQDY